MACPLATRNCNYSMKGANARKFTALCWWSSFAVTVARFSFNLSSLPSTNGFQIWGAAPSNFAGSSVSSAGDFNGDGINDYIIGAYGGGISYVLFGQRGTPGLLPNIDLATMATDINSGFRIIGANGATDYSGWRVASAGDINGDLVSDLLVGAYQASPTAGTAYAGITYVLFGHKVTSAQNAFGDISLAGFTNSATTGFRIVGALSSDLSGYAVGSAGDVNNDGISDIMLGAIGASPGGKGQAGISYVVFGRANAYSDISLNFGSGSPLGFRILGAAVNDYSGNCVVKVGDVNGDGRGDVIVGAAAADLSASQENAGAAYVVFGQISTFAFVDIDIATMVPGPSTGFRILGINADDLTGVWVGAAGDVNGDMVDDIIVSARGGDRDASRANSGIVYILFGRIIAADITLSTMITGPSSGYRILGAAYQDQIGDAFSGLGDFNGDGVRDIIIGASNALNAAGSTYVVFGRRGGAVADFDLASIATGSSRGFRMLGATAGDKSGFSVANVGDINGDGIDDMLIGAQTGTPSNGKSQAGVSYVIFGAWDSPTSQPSSQPSRRPTGQPSSQPSRRPTSQPSSQPTRTPTAQPSGRPTRQPSTQPTVRPSSQPTSRPSSQPSRQPTCRPSGQPTSQPSAIPTRQPSTQPTSQPSMQPSARPTTQPTSRPSGQPSNSPSTQPSAQPTHIPSAQPTVQPSALPTQQPSVQPSRQPSNSPSSRPTAQPSMQPQSAPSSTPSSQPTAQPTATPSSQPSSHPSTQPSSQPFSQPTCTPSSQPTEQPSARPSSIPSEQPLAAPSARPSGQPSSAPSTQPTSAPSSQPVARPSAQPTSTPSSQPSAVPSSLPSAQPSMQPQSAPSSTPSSQPTAQPTATPSSRPSSQPSMLPTIQPSTQPSSRPSSQPTSTPSSQPSGTPSGQPMAAPSAWPSGQPSSAPSTQPTSVPSTQPVIKPSAQPTSTPSSHPSAQPSAQLTLQPSAQPSQQPRAAPSAQPTTAPSARPTLAPTGEWATLVSQNVTHVFHPDSHVWACGSRSNTNFTSCVLAAVASGDILKQYRFDWNIVTSVLNVGTATSVVVNGRSSINAVATSEVAVCTPDQFQLQCTARSFYDTRFIALSYVPFPDIVVYVGWTNVHTSITMVNVKTGLIQSNIYSASNMKGLAFSQILSPPNFLGSFVAGTAIRATATPVNYIVAGMFRTDGGSLRAMVMKPVSGDILNSADLVNAMALEYVGPDSFVAGGLQLADVAGTHAYLLRANALFNTISYCVRYRSLSGGGRRALSVGTAVSQSVSRGLVRIEDTMFVIIDRTSNNITALTVLKTSIVDGSIAKQVHVTAPNSTNLYCTDITAVDAYLSIVCTWQQTVSSVQSVMILVNQALSFAKLPIGFVRSEGTVFEKESLAFQRTVLTITQTAATLATSTYEFNTADRAPTRRPSYVPTPGPSSIPSSAPSGQPSSSPTAAPSVSARPTSQPSSAVPTITHRPTVEPTISPTKKPSAAPTPRPSFRPTTKPSARPTVQPTDIPTVQPRALSTVVPSRLPSAAPTYKPTPDPTRIPSLMPTSSEAFNDSTHRRSSTPAYVVGASVGGGLGIMFIGFVLYKYYEHAEEEKARELRRIDYMKKQALLAELRDAEIADEEDRNTAFRLQTEQVEYADKQHRKRARKTKKSSKDGGAGAYAAGPVQVPPAVVILQDSDSSGSYSCSYSVSTLRSGERSSALRDATRCSTGTEEPGESEESDEGSKGSEECDEGSEDSETPCSSELSDFSEGMFGLSDTSQSVSSSEISGEDVV